MSSEQVLDGVVLESLVKAISFTHVQGTTIILCSLILINNGVVTGSSGTLPVDGFSMTMATKLARNDANRKLAEIATIFVNDGLTGCPVQQAITSKLNALKEHGNERH